MRLAAAARAALLVAVLAAAPCARGGNNGLAQTPPLSWRSWNQFSFNINASLILRIADALVDGSRPIAFRPPGTSLRDLGVRTLGIDEGWQACAPKPGFPDGNWSWHRSAADGSIAPVVNETLFPSLRDLVAALAARGLATGFYLNGCSSYCWELGDTCGDECNAGDVAALVEAGFASVKFDGCSKQHNMTLWAALLNATAPAPILVENCHNTANPVAPIAEGGCPAFHTYRTSTDIRNNYASWMNNAQSVAPFFDGRHGPGCWAYPDMNCLGVSTEINGAYFVQPSAAEGRTHWGVWSVLSSPLTLSLDLTNATAVDAVWPVLTNVDALNVNQAWAGAPGGVFAVSAANVTLQHCTPDWDGDRNCTLPRTQSFYKPLPDGAAAVLVANHGMVPADVSVVLAEVPGLACGAGAGSCAVFDIWAQSAAGVASGSYTVRGLPSHDSLYVVLGPYTPPH